MAQSFQSALEFVERQQQESLQSLRSLQVKHREWQQTLKDLLADAKAAEIERHAAVDAVDVEREERQEPQPKVSLVSAASIQSAASWSSFVAPLRSQAGRKAFYGQEKTLSRLSNKSVGSSRSRLQSLRQSTLERLPNIVLEVLMDDASETVEEKPGICQSEMCRKLSSAVDSQAFEYVVGFLILLNMALIGLEAEMQLQGMDTAWASNIERGFLTLYSLELLVRLVAGGLSIFKSPWHLLDLLLVSVGLLALVLVPLLEQGGRDDWERLLIIRGLRLLRLARVLRTLQHFKVVWRLVSGLLSAWDTLASTMGLILLWLYIFGCVAIEVISNDQVLLENTLTAAIIEKNFSSLPQATLTLFQFVSMDAIAAVYYPLVVAKPVLIIYFLPLLMFLSIALMNLVTAVLVEHALAQSSAEAEAERVQKKEEVKLALPALLDAFDGLDADGSGFITRDEVAGVPTTILPPAVLSKVSANSMDDLFEMIDINQTGMLTQLEFLEGLMRLLLLDMPVWALQLQRQLVPLQRQSAQIAAAVSTVNDRESREVF